MKPYLVARRKAFRTISIALQHDCKSDESSDVLRLLVYTVW
jgi:hypothetical protein